MAVYRRLMSTPVILAAVSIACRQSGSGSVEAHNVGNPTDVVAEYLYRDSRGERLQPDQWFRSVWAWEDEPAWDEITLIRSYEIEGDSIVSDTARIAVRYEVLGVLQGTPEGTPMRFVPREGSERVEFVVAKTGVEWQVTFPSINPHVLADSILTYRPGILSPEHAAVMDSLLNR